MSTVALYARYSTDRQDARSIDDQLRRCRAWAEARALQITAEYHDAAQSGATMLRAGMQRLLAAARSKPVPFNAVLVDDLSRLSRDLGDTWTIVFGDLRSAGVRVIDCTTGMASDGAGARLTFGAMALVNDTFLQLVRTETHRGLEGRALAGFHTGGRCYGYHTVPEPNPTDPERPRAVLRIEDREAAIVQRVFNAYVAGDALGRIAAALNADGVRAPYDGRGYSKPAGRGWGMNQIHSMLRNERYIGRVVWNKREFFRDPTTKKRHARLRPEKEWVTSEAPELAIVSRELWDAAQARHRTARRGGVVNGKKRIRLLSGLLRCGVCGSSMSIVGARGQWANYGCSAHHAKGDAICANRKLISERQVNQMVLRGLVDYVQSPSFQTWVEEATAVAERARTRTKGGEELRLVAAVRAQHAKTEKIAATLVEVGVSESLRAMLAREEERLRDLRRQLAEVSVPPVARATLNLRQAAQAFEDIEQLVQVDPSAARARLARYLEPVVFTPVEEDGELVYTAEITLNNETAALAGGRVIDGSGCGGRI